ncbi:MAG: nucleotide exchange factor GrpE [Spirochaetales bacterium]|nr:nucleotide exchange factor GrpE [Spirochaetales bacterium]
MNEENDVKEEYHITPEQTKTEFDEEEKKEPMEGSDKEEKSDKAGLDENKENRDDVTDKEDKEKPDNTDNGISNSALYTKLSGISNILETLKHLFESRISKDELLSDRFRDMRNELKEYKEQFVYNNILKKMFLDVITLHDKIQQIMNDLVLYKETPQNILNHFEAIEKELLFVLKKQSVHEIEIEHNTKFDERYHQAAEKEKTANPDEDLTISKVLQKGFMYNDILLRPAKVIVKKYYKEES